MLIRPRGGDIFDVSRSVHWHVLQEVDYRSPDEGAQKIDWVAIRQADGTTEEFIAQNMIKVSADVTPDVEAIKAAEPNRQMDCITCHNRVGHPIPQPRSELDYDLSIGRIDPSLPYVKLKAMNVLLGDYPSVQAAGAAASVRPTMG